MWELTTRANVDYVINLSARDYPLMRNERVHRDLQAITNATGKDIFLKTPGDAPRAERRLRASWLLTSDQRGISEIRTSRPGRPLPAVLHGGRVVKNHQWMALSPDALDYLRMSGDALNLLAYSEFSFIPDEFYFATAFHNSPYWHRVHEDNFRYLRFHGGPHPATLKMKDRVHFPPDALGKYHFARKIDDSGLLVRWIDENHLDPAGPCTMDQVGWKLGCLRGYLLRWGYHMNSTVTVTQLSDAEPRSARNQRDVTWNCDLDRHDRAMAEGVLSVYIYSSPCDMESLEKLFTREGFHLHLRV
jgi:hypothetical protein